MLVSAIRRAARLHVSRRSLATLTAGDLQLEKVGIKPASKKILYNLSYPEIAAEEKARKEGVFTDNGTFCVDTGIFTGRSPKDKWIVKQAPSDKEVGWGSVNQPMKPEVFDKLYDSVLKHYEGVKEAFVFDGYCGANKNSRRNVRFVTELAWQHHFVTNMFIRPKTTEELKGFQPDFTVINACKVTNPDWKAQGLNSEVFVAFNIEKKVAIIGGTYYGGEMKKGIFSMMNYWLPLKGIMPMHCSANNGPEGTALFFGLSGTGKTTLSADPERLLIGDDEHGWDDDGIFNFEGGCYAKTIDLSHEKEPQVWEAITPDALLENVPVDPKTGVPNYADRSKTENTRVSYPLEHVKERDPLSLGQHPKNIIFLTADAYGVLPPVSILTHEQAMYHFLSGYTAKVAGTERGVKEPTATFSSAFGAAFMTLHPTRYADLLLQKLKKHGSNVYLVNTGWTGGPYGVGKRIDLPSTRSIIHQILNGSVLKSPTETHPIFNVKFPTALAGVNPTLLNPKKTWASGDKYDETAKKLAGMFIKNFEPLKAGSKVDYSVYGPKL